MTEQVLSILRLRARAFRATFGITAALACLSHPVGAEDIALDSSQEARAQAGDHQFYVWCTGGDDFTTTQSGDSADAAQEAVFEALQAEGKDRCWPIWQGKR